MLTRKDKLVNAFIIVFTVVFIAVGVIQGITLTAKAEMPSSITANYDVDLPSGISSYYNSAVSQYCSTHNISNEVGNYIAFVSYFSSSDFSISIAKINSSDSQSIRFERDPGIDSAIYGRCFFDNGFSEGMTYYLSNGQLESYSVSTYFSMGPVNSGTYYLNFTTISSSTINLTLNFIPDSWGENLPDRYGSIDSISDAGLLSELYDISFIVQGVSDDKHSSLISRSLEVTPVGVVDDTGFNLIYLEVPQLGTELYHNDVVWGYYLFRPRYDTDKYYFNGLKLSFAYDPLKDVEDLGSYPASSFFEASVDSQPIRANAGTTVNSMSFFFGGTIHNYSNRTLIGFDYSSTSNNLYPTFMFHSVATCNRYSAGSFCYNFDDDGLMKVDEQGNASVATDDDKDDLADKGNDRNNNKKQKLGYVPRGFSGGTLNADFGSWDTPSPYDFSVLSTLLEAIFNPFVVTLMTACVVIGIIGYVLYGKN